MATIEDIMDAVEAVGIATIADVTSFEELRSGESLAESEYPAQFVHSPDETNDLIACQQNDSTLVMILDLWTNSETRKEVLARVELFRAGIAADRSLGGIVDFANVSAVSVGEFPDKAHKLARIVVTTNVVT